MNNFIQAFLVLACLMSMPSCSSNFSDTVQSEISVIEQLATLTYTSDNACYGSHRTCIIEETTLNINFDVVHCKQRSSNELYLDVYAIDGFLYLLLRNQYIADVAYYEYTDNDDFRVAVDDPSYEAAYWQDIQIVRLRYSSVISCIHTAKLELSIGSYCTDIPTLLSK